MRRRMIGGAAVLGLLCTLAACSSGNSGSDGSESGGETGGGFPEDVAVSAEVFRGVPENVDWIGDGIPDVGVLAGWVVEGETFAVVTWGSSSCPPVASHLTVESADRMALSFERSPNEMCTADYAPTTHELALPKSITDRPVTLIVDIEDAESTETFTLP